VIDVLPLTQAHAWSVKKTMREGRLTFPLEYSHLDDDISHTVANLQIMKRAAERQGWQPHI